MERHEELLMPIDEQYARAILAGRKRYEIRKCQLRFPPGTRIWLYASKTSRAGATGAILGSFICGGCSPITGERALRAIAMEAATTPMSVRTYLGGKQGWAIEVASYQRLKAPLLTTLHDLRMWRRFKPSPGDRNLRRLLGAASKYRQKQPRGATTSGAKSTRSNAL